MTQHSEYGFFVRVPSQWKRFPDVPLAAQIGRDHVVNNGRHGYDSMTQHRVNEVVATDGNARIPENTVLTGWEPVMFAGTFSVNLDNTGRGVALVVRVGIDQSPGSGVTATWRVSMFADHERPERLPNVDSGFLNSTQVAKTGSFKGWADPSTQVIRDGQKLRSMRSQNEAGTDRSSVDVDIGSIAVWVRTDSVAGVSPSNLRLVGLHVREFRS